MLLPRILRTFGRTIGIPLGFARLTAIGWLGILLAPTTTPYVWGLLLGIGGGAFPWTMSLIPLRSNTVAGTAALSGFVQTIGYLIAAIGPFGVGVLHDLTGSWTPSLIGLTLVCVPFAAVGAYLVRAPQLEDTLGP